MPRALGRDRGGTEGGGGVSSDSCRADYAFHSAQMDPIEDGLRRDLPVSQAADSEVPMISTVTGAPVSPDPKWNADYWWRNVRRTRAFCRRRRTRCSRRLHRAASRSVRIP